MKFAIAALPHTFPAPLDPAADERRRLYTQRETHESMLWQLHDEGYDGYAIGIRFGENGVEHPELWGAERTVLWSALVPPVDGLDKPRRVTSAVVIRSPRAPLYSPATAVHSTDVLRRGVTTPSSDWFRWVLAHLGAIPGEDTVVNLATGRPVPEFTSMITLEGALA